MSEKITTLRPQTELSPEKAAGVARLRQITEDYIKGTIGGVCVIIADKDGLITEDDVIGDVLAGDLHMHCHTLMIALASNEGD